LAFRVLPEKPSTQRYLLLGLAGITVLLLLIRPDKAPELREVVAPRVIVAPVTLHDLVPHETVSGRLEPVRKALLRFELSGQVRGRQVEPGQAVEAGALLLVLDEGDYRDALEKAAAQLALEKRNIQRDRELLQLARRNRTLQEGEVARLEKLGKESLVSRSRLDEARISLLKMEAEVAQLDASVGSAASRLSLMQAERNRAARNLERTRLQAPFPGRVNAVEVQEGDYVTPSQPVLELIDTSALELYVEVRGDVVKALVQGQAVTVSIADNAYAGEIVALQTDPDPVTFTHALRVRLAGEGIRPGEVARVRLPLHPLTNAAVIPAAAVLRDEGKTYVFRVRQDRLEKSEVVLGHRVGDLQVVRSGVHAGDLVVIQDVAALSDGQKVYVTREGQG